MRGYWRAKALVVDIEALELHQVLGERARLIRHYVLDLPQFLVDAAGLHLSRLPLAAALLILIQNRPLAVSHSFDGHNQADGYEIGEADEPAAPSVEDIAGNAAR